MTEDVKALLARAMGDEPPLRIDREEVLQQGRKRLRRKRVIEVGGVVAAVVVAVVGATTLTNLVDAEPERLPPAASSTQLAPPGLQLPLTTTPLPDVPTTAETSAGPPITISDANAPRLTALLYATGVVSESDVQPTSSRPGTPEFVAAKDRYIYEADIVRPDEQGYLQVVVGYTSDITPGCAAVVVDGNCSIASKDGVQVTLIHTSNPLGQLQTMASAKFRSGIRVAVTVSNATFQETKDAKTPLNKLPFLTDDQVCFLTTKVGLGA